MVVDTRNWLPHKQVLASSEWIERVDACTEVPRRHDIILIAKGSEV
jgi:hypothetical protein